MGVYLPPEATGAGTLSGPLLTVCTQRPLFGLSPPSARRALRRVLLL